jgi:P27 family predicted phage terminase small subunit
MGKRGPAPSPTATKRARGVRSDRVARGEPRPTPFEEIPEPPEHLDEVGKEVWCRLVPDLIERGVLTPWDVDQFARYCALESVIRTAEEHVLAGLYVPGRRDQFVTNPGWRIYRDAVKAQLLLAREFGLTPSARSMLAVHEEEGGDE